MGWRCWNSLPAGGWPAGWLVKQKQMGEGPKFSPEHGGPRPRECGVQLGG